jgi:hypothetical protein
VGDGDVMNLIVSVDRVANARADERHDDDRDDDRRSYRTLAAFGWWTARRSTVTPASPGPGFGSIGDVASRIGPGA